MQPAVGAIPADSFAQPVAASAAQRQGRVAFVGVVHPPDLGKPLRPGQVVAELLEHAAARRTGASWYGSPTSTVLTRAVVVAANSFSRSWVATIEASSTTSTRRAIQRQRAGLDQLQRLGHRAGRGRPPPRRGLTSTALPVGATTSTSLHPRCAPARSAYSECVLPAPAGAGSGCTSHGETAMLAMARAWSADKSSNRPSTHIEPGAVVAAASADPRMRGFLGDDRAPGCTSRALRAHALPRGAPMRTPTASTMRLDQRTGIARRRPRAAERR